MDDPYIKRLAVLDRADQLLSGVTLHTVAGSLCQHLDRNRRLIERARECLAGLEAKTAMPSA